MTVEISSPDLRTLEVDLSGAPFRSQWNLKENIKRGARLVSNGMRADAAGHRYLKHLPTAVSWETKEAGYAAEIGLGPKKGTQGSLAHIIVYGSVNNFPVYDHTSALRRNTSAIERIFAEGAEDAVLGGDR